MPKSKVSLKRRTRIKTKAYREKKRKAFKENQAENIDVYDLGFNAQEFAVRMNQQIAVRNAIRSGKIQIKGK